MEKLTPGDVLKNVHAAAESLQMMIDQKSYLLLNSESWGSGPQAKELKDIENLLEEMTDANMHLNRKSMSETVLDLRSVCKWTAKNEDSEENFRKQPSWPTRFLVHSESIKEEDEFRTYESASAMSLATFASLMIEFVARLGNVVDTYEELSEKAKFKDPNYSGTTAAKDGGFWKDLFGCFS